MSHSPGGGLVAALDARLSPAYMRRVMIRFLVTLLVLMSGLAAEGVAADARAFGACAEVGVVETGYGAPCAVSAGIPRAAMASPFVRALPVPHPAALTLPPRTVFTRIDRARE